MKLSNIKKQGIKHRLLNKAFSKKEEEIKQRVQKLADKIYFNVYPWGVRKQMQSMPEGFLPTDNCLLIQFGNGSCITGMEYGEQRRISYKHRRGCAKSYDSLHQFTVEYSKIKLDEETLARERKQLRIEITAVLTSVNTDNQLIECWPEIKPIVLEVMGVDNSPKNLPSIPIKTLNEKIGLTK